MHREVIIRLIRTSMCVHDLYHRGQHSHDFLSCLAQELEQQPGTKASCHQYDFEPWRQPEELDPYKNQPAQSMLQLQLSNNIQWWWKIQVIFAPMKQAFYLCGSLKVWRQGVEQSLYHHPWLWQVYQKVIRYGYKRFIDFRNNHLLRLTKAWLQVVEMKNTAQIFRHSYARLSQQPFQIPSNTKPVVQSKTWKHDENETMNLAMHIYHELTCQKLKSLLVSAPHQEAYPNSP